MKVLAVGGIEDHLHILLSLPATIDVAKAAQLIKGGSSKWLNDKYFKQREFAWQEGYGAFGVNRSSIAAVRRYIQNQEEHHRTKTFQEEYLEFLKMNEIEYDERFLW